MVKEFYKHKRACPNKKTYFGEHQYNNDKRKRGKLTTKRHSDPN